MISQNDIEISGSQLNQLLSQHEKHAFKYLVENGIYCNKCSDYCKLDISNHKVYLDRYNDIKVMGECKCCGSEVSKIIEFGENESFFRKAVQFRNTRNILIESE